MKWVNFLSYYILLHNLIKCLNKLFFITIFLNLVTVMHNLSKRHCHYALIKWYYKVRWLSFYAAFLVIIFLCLLLVSCLSWVVVHKYIWKCFSHLTELCPILFLQAGGSSPSNFSIGEYLQGATLAFILIGTFIFLLGIFGCVGACCQVECCLIIVSADLY